MNATETPDVIDVLTRVKAWPPTLRITLARRILEGVEAAGAADADSSGHRGSPVQRLIGLGAGSQPPPDDAQVRQWLDEHRMEQANR